MIRKIRPSKTARIKLSLESRRFFHYHSIETLNILSLGSLIKTEEMIVIDNVEILCETRVKIIRDDYELKTAKRRH